MGLTTEKKDIKYTYGDYLKWPEDERWEIIEGVAYNMSPRPSTMHQRILRKIVFQFESYLKGKQCEVFFAPFDVRFPVQNQKDNETDTVVQPDIVIVCDKTKLDDRGCKGAPNLIIEIISPSTAGRDKKVKHKLYEAAGVGEYWIIDPDGKILEVYLLEPENGYGKPEVYTQEDTVKVGIFQDLSIDLQEVFA